VKATRRVWDPAVRVLHWALAATFALGWATTEWLGAWHRPVGYAALAIVVARIAWGFTGARYARFSQFVRGPRATLAYAREVLARREARHLGHNPLGALMALAWFACIGGLALTGWLYRTDRFWGDETVERIHLALAWTGLALVLVHVAGVALASFRHRENLVVAMIRGDKREPEEHDIA
jgi:cytochrome b